MMSPRSEASPRHGIARVISKLGVCSRTQAQALVRAGRVRVNGRLVRDPEEPTVAGRDRISIDGADIGEAQRVYLALNKPRGFVTTASDERGRRTVYELLGKLPDGMQALPWVAPVGRLDQASEGLLLFSNDSEWAARLTAPESHVDKIYHVQIGALVDAALLAALRAGRIVDGELLRAKAVRGIRQGEKNSWLEIVLDEGRNRQIRRLFDAFDISVLRLIRVAVGTVELGALAKGDWRRLSADEVAALSPTSQSAASSMSGGT